MTARELQTALVEDLKELFKDSYFQTPYQKMAPLGVFRQRLPKRDAQSEEDPFPYIIVRLDHGGLEGRTSAHKVSVLLVIGVFDDALLETKEPPPTEGWDTRNFGPEAVLEIIERIQAHYEKHPSLEGGAFYFDGPFNWALQDEDSYPYYYGACEMEFTLAAPRRERSQFT